MEVKIKLKIKDVEIELSREDAQELRDILNGLVAKEKEYIPYPITYPITYPVYPDPYPHRPWSPWYGEHWDVTWSGTSNNALPAEMSICLNNI